jgi:hypothetical protein
MTFDDAEGRAISRSASLLPLSGDDSVSTLSGALQLELRSGTRWMSRAHLTMDDDEIELTPLFRFQMRGAGYSHPTFAHGRWHGGPIQEGEILDLNDLDPLEYANIHVQHVVRTTSAKGSGLGVLEQLIIGPYAPCGLEGLLDGAR